jgi:hypothetical protein
MAISNTSILIKRSTTTGRPGSLNAGEFAYSYASNTLFIGTPGGNGVVNVGGQYYTTTLDSATNANTASTLVKRDTNGAFSGRLYGNSNTASSLLNAQNFSISGGDISAGTVSFDGTGAVVLNASLNSVPGLSAGYYGGSTISSSTIPVIQVAANGRIMSISNTTVTSSFSISDGINSNTVYSGSTATFTGSKGITTAVNSANETITFGTDNTVARTNVDVGTQIFNTGIIIPTNDVNIGGTLYAHNIQISGNVTTSNVSSTLNIGDPIIYLAANNSGDSVDIGFVGHFVGPGSTGYSHYQHTGMVRDYTDKKWKFFSNVYTEPSSTVDFNANTIYDVIKVGGVDTSNGAITGATITLTSDFTAGGNTLLSGPTVIAGKANLSSDLGVAGNAYIAGNQVVGGTFKVTGATTLTGNANTTNNLGVGGTFYAAGSSLLGNSLTVNGATTLVGQANTTNDFGVGGNAYLANNLRVGGAVTFANALTVPNGGTGQTSFTKNSIIYGNDNGSLLNTAAAGVSDQGWSNQILTVTNAGVPVWSTAMDGGQF